MKARVLAKLTENQVFDWIYETLKEYQLKLLSSQRAAAAKSGSKVIFIEKEPDFF